jgi:uncharacterized protein YkwD
MITKRVAAISAGIASVAVAASVAGLVAVGGMGATTTLSLAPAAVTNAQQSAILAQHNTARNAVGVAPLTWSTKLAADAQGWADHLAAGTGDITHSDRASNGNEGENLARSGSASASPTEGVQSWLDEKSVYDGAANKSGFNDSNPQWKEFGHYTQMVWSTTSQLGCGTAVGKKGLITVCRYLAAGNIDGQLAYQPGGGTKPTPAPTPTPAPNPTVNPADCAYNPGGRGGYGSYVDGLALDLRDWELDLSKEINAYRQQHGVKALTYSRQLARPAMWASLDDYNRNSNASHVDSRGMDVAQRVQYCSGYTGKVAEVTYGNTTVAGSTVQAAFTFYKNNASQWLLDPTFTTWSGAQMAYGGNDTQRAPAWYTIVLGDH